MSRDLSSRYHPGSTGSVVASSSRSPAHYSTASSVVPGLPQQSSSSASASTNFRRNHTSHTRQLNSGYHPYGSGHTRPYHEARSPSARPSPTSHMHPKIRPSGQMVFYLRDHAQVEHTIDQYREKLAGPLGLDLEHRPNFTKGSRPNKTALVQLASDSIILLVQVSAMPNFPPSIRNLIEDPAIIKAGVGIKGDAEKLWKDFGISASGCLELGNLARAVDTQWATWKGMIGLARLVKAYEDRVFKKPKSIQMGNWELFLTDKQLDYAADDADAGLTVLKKLLAILPSVSPAPPESNYIFRMSRGQAETLSGAPFPPPHVKTATVEVAKASSGTATAAVNLTAVSA